LIFDEFSYINDVLLLHLLFLSSNVCMFLGRYVTLICSSSHKHTEFACCVWNFQQRDHRLSFASLAKTSNKNCITFQNAMFTIFLHNYHFNEYLHRWEQLVCVMNVVEDVRRHSYVLSCSFGIPFKYKSKTNLVFWI
jgi:hypothetical protein